MSRVLDNVPSSISAFRRVYPAPTGGKPARGVSTRVRPRPRRHATCGPGDGVPGNHFCLAPPRPGHGCEDAHLHTAAVDAVRFSVAPIQPVFEQHGLEVLPVFVFSLEAGEDDATVYSRMFAPAFGIPEDPATGGASGPLGAYLLRQGAVSATVARHMVSLQGATMGRPSRVHISIASEGGSITSVRVGGAAVLVAEGVLCL